MRHYAAVNLLFPSAWYRMFCARRCGHEGVHDNEIWRVSVTETAQLIETCGSVQRRSSRRTCTHRTRQSGAERDRPGAGRRCPRRGGRGGRGGRRRGLGPLHGVPFTVKENIDMAGLPTTWGVPALAQAVAPLDAPVVQRMRAAGAIPIGRTNLPDMALRVHTDSQLHGPTRNPWIRARTRRRLERRRGGGAGHRHERDRARQRHRRFAAQPGQRLRHRVDPSVGRPRARRRLRPAEDRLLAVQSMNVQGPMARRVADVRAALKVLIGAHPRDPWSIDAPFDGAPLHGRCASRSWPSRPADDRPGGRCDRSPLRRRTRRCRLRRRRCVSAALRGSDRCVGAAADRRLRGRAAADAAADGCRRARFLAQRRWRSRHSTARRAVGS